MKILISVIHVILLALIIWLVVLVFTPKANADPIQLSQNNMEKMK